jgi:hypothetical protein
MYVIITIYDTKRNVRKKTQKYQLLHLIQPLPWKQVWLIKPFMPCRWSLHWKFRITGHLQLQKPFCLQTQIQNIMWPQLLSVCYTYLRKYGWYTLLVCPPNCLISDNKFPAGNPQYFSTTKIQILGSHYVLDLGL